MKRIVLLAAVAVIGVALGCGKKEPPLAKSISDDGQSVATVEKSGDKEAVVIDGRNVGVFDAVTSKPIYIPETHTPVYAVRTESGEQMMKGTAPISGKYEQVSRPEVAPDGTTVVFTAKRGDKNFVVTDKGVESEGYDEVSNLCAGNKGTFAYIARAGDKQVIVKGGQATAMDERYSMPGSLVLSPNGQSLAFTAVTPSGNIIVRDGIEVGDGESSIWAPVFSPDSASLAYIISRNGKCSVILNETPVGGQYDSILTPPVFSADSRSILFVATKGGKRVVVKDGVQVGQGHGSIWGVTLSPDGKSVAFSAQQGNERFVVRNGERVKGRYESVGCPLFSPDSRTVAFVAWSGGKCFVVKDGQVVTGRFDQIGALSTSKDGTQIMCAVTDGEKVTQMLVPW